MMSSYTKFLHKSSVKPKTCQKGVETILTKKEKEANTKYKNNQISWKCPQNQQTDKKDKKENHT